MKQRHRRQLAIKRPRLRYVACTAPGLRMASVISSTGTPSIRKRSVCRSWVVLYEVTQALGRHDSNLNDGKLQLACPTTSRCPQDDFRRPVRLQPELAAS